MDIKDFIILFGISVAIASVVVMILVFTVMTFERMRKGSHPSRDERPFRPYEEGGFMRGERDCKEGVPHKEGQSYEYDEGYAFEYMREQVETARSEQCQTTE
jgi:hypothetical protein